MKECELGFGKKGQVAIFIIIGLVIVIAGVLIFVISPGELSNLIVGGGGLENPQIELKNCIQEDLAQTIATISAQGGDVNPQHYILYDDNKVRYLSYTNNYYDLGVNQEPLLINHVEGEIESLISEKAESCFEDLVSEFESKGYVIESGRGDITVELVPENVVVNFDRSLSVSKGDEDRTYEGFDIVVDNNIYELLEIANKILDDEAKYGNTETTFLMDQYHDVKVEKDLKTDGSAIYTLTNRKTGEKFLFASRSLVLPPGYGIIQ